MRHQLSLALSAIVCQQLVPKKDGAGRVVATELLIATDAIRNHIRRGSFHQLHGELTLGRRFGMLTMEDSLAAPREERRDQRGRGESPRGAPGRSRSAAEVIRLSPGRGSSRGRASSSPRGLERPSRAAAREVKSTAR